MFSRTGGSDLLIVFTAFRYWQIDTDRCWMLVAWVKYKLFAMVYTVIAFNSTFYSTYDYKYYLELLVHVQNFILYFEHVLAICPHQSIFVYLVNNQISISST